MKVYAADRYFDRDSGSRFHTLTQLAGKPQWIKMHFDFRRGDYYLKVVNFTNRLSASKLAWRFKGLLIPAYLVDDPRVTYPRNIPWNRICTVYSLQVMDVYLTKPIDILSEDEIQAAVYRE